MMRSFAGFRAGLSRHTPLPDSFFSELLPLIDDLAELQLTLCCCRALAQKDAPVRYLRVEELEQDEHLLAALGQAAPGQPPAETLQCALARALGRRTLLAVDISAEHTVLTLYVLNSEEGRELVTRIETDEWRPGDVQDPIEILPVRTSLFQLYEENIGVVTPLLAEELKEAEANFPITWLKEAVKLAVESNVRNWRYIHAILKRWEREGRYGANEQRRKDERYPFK